MEGGGDGVGIDSQEEEVAIVTERGEEKLGVWGNTIEAAERREEDDDNETQVERNCETQINTELLPGILIDESSQRPDLDNRTSRKRNRRGRYRSLDEEILNSSKVGEVTTTDTSGEAGGEETEGRDQKKRRTSSTRSSRRMSSTRSLNRRSSSSEDLEEIRKQELNGADLRHKLDKLRAEGNSASSSRRSSQNYEEAESYKSFESSEDLLSEGEGNIQVIDDN